MESNYILPGWYFDIDTIHMKNLNFFIQKSIFSTDNYLMYEDESKKHDFLTETDLGFTIANGAFHIVKNESLFLWSIMKYFQKEYSSNLWSSGGSDVVTKAYKEACLIESHEKRGEQCQGLEIVNPKYFFPFPWFKASSISNQRKSLEEWEDFFKDAYSADFFASSGAGSSNTRVQRPKFYGRQKPAFLYLGPKYCPTSYFSAKLF